MSGAFVVGYLLAVQETMSCDRQVHDLTWAGGPAYYSVDML